MVYLSIYIWLILIVNVGKHTSPMDPMAVLLMAEFQRSKVSLLIPILRRGPRSSVDRSLSAASMAPVQGYSG